MIAPLDTQGRQLFNSDIVIDQVECLGEARKDYSTNISAFELKKIKLGFGGVIPKINSLVHSCINDFHIREGWSDG